MSGRLFDPMRQDGSFPFQITDRTATDVRATWDRLCPGWRERKPGQKHESKVCDYRQRVTRAK